MEFKGKSIISIKDFSKDEILKIMDTASLIEQNKNKNLLQGFNIASLFYEPSTRTRLSFDSAMTWLGGNVIGFTDPNSSSAKKGETLYDTAKMVEAYADVVVIRHPLEGTARLFADSISIPVINAGDGANQHPTQTLLDLYTIQKSQGKIEKISIAFVGDLKYGRTVHSLVCALSLFNCDFYFVAPEILQIPESYLDDLKEKNINYSLHEKIEDVVRKVDILYMTRIQKERFPDINDYDKVKDIFVLKKNMLNNVKENLKILHPLPRVNEISVDVDDTKYAYYFQQAANGIPIRQALLCLLLGVDL
jgi:aspartate carbamoyltransferase catalytic subunit